MARALSSNFFLSPASSVQRKAANLRLKCANRKVSRRAGMAVKVGINGFGRIGRNILRTALGDKDIDFVAVNDITDTKTLAHLLKYDSVLGNLEHDIKASAKGITVEGEEFQVFCERDPSLIPWESVGAEIVIESTGRFTKAEDAKKHLRGSVKKVIISAPAKNEDITIVLGVNNEKYDPAKHNIVSNASCTTNCLAPLVHVLLKEGFGIEEGLMTTVHSYTATQKTVDGPSKKDWKGGRSAAINLIPSTTGAARAVGLVCPEVKGKLTGMSFRVPTPTVSVVDLTVRTVKETSYAEISAAMKKASETYLKDILDYTKDEVVSSDFIHCPASSIYDEGSGIELNKRFFKLVSWYDNEWGYSNRVADLLRYMLEKGV